MLLNLTKALKYVVPSRKAKAFLVAFPISDLIFFVIPGTRA